jgi:hypothetical protein
VAVNLEVSRLTQKRLSVAHGVLRCSSATPALVRRLRELRRAVKRVFTSTTLELVKFQYDFMHELSKSKAYTNLPVRSGLSKWKFCWERYVSAGWIPYNVHDETQFGFDTNYYNS